MQWFLLIVAPIWSSWIGSLLKTLDHWELWKVWSWIVDAMMLLTSQRAPAQAFDWTNLLSCVCVAILQKKWFLLQAPHSHGSQNYQESWRICRKVAPLVSTEKSSVLDQYFHSFTHLNKQRMESESSCNFLVWTSPMTWQTFWGFSKIPQMRNSSYKSIKW